MGITCAIHQPNFFPWLGYFDKIKRSDIFVFLDDVQIQKTGGSWVNRTKLNCFGSEKWYTCPIMRTSGTMQVNQAKLSGSKWGDDFIGVLKNYYRKHPNCDKVINIVTELVHKKRYDYLEELNRDIIVYFSGYFGFKTEFILKSALDVQSSSTEMLIGICNRVGANTYLCGAGAAGYQEDHLFEQADLKLVYQQYQPEVYGNPETFLPGLSILDYLMSV